MGRGSTSDVRRDDAMGRGSNPSLPTIPIMGVNRNDRDYFDLKWSKIVPTSLIVPKYQSQVEGVSFLHYKDKI